MLTLHNARQGFLPRADFEAILPLLGRNVPLKEGKRFEPDHDLQDYVEWAWRTAMRKGEVAKLTWRMLDQETWTLRLHASGEKARKGRSLALEGQLQQIMERRLERRRLDCPLIFYREDVDREGRPIARAVGDFRKAWATAAAAAGLAGVLFHDLRRSAIRNMRGAGVQETVIMSISGHRTRATFDRYNIVDERDQRAAIATTEAYVAGLPLERKVASMSAKRTGHNVAVGGKEGRRGGPGGLGSR
jgi:integrase